MARTITAHRTFPNSFTPSKRERYRGSVEGGVERILGRYGATEVTPFVVPDRNTPMEGFYEMGEGVARLACVLGTGPGSENWVELSLNLLGGPEVWDSGSQLAKDVTAYLRRRDMRVKK